MVTAVTLTQTETGERCKIDSIEMSILKDPQMFLSKLCVHNVGLYYFLKR